MARAQTGREVTPKRRQAVLALVEAGELTSPEACRLLGVPRWRLSALARTLSVKPREARWAHIRAKLAETMGAATGGKPKTAI
jgi:hypothetical protein